GGAPAIEIEVEDWRRTEAITFTCGARTGGGFTETGGKATRSASARAWNAYERLQFPGGCAYARPRIYAREPVTPLLCPAENLTVSLRKGRTPFPTWRSKRSTVRLDVRIAVPEQISRPRRTDMGVCPCKYFGVSRRRRRKRFHVVATVFVFRRKAPKKFSCCVQRNKSLCAFVSSASVLP
uniref:Uncharacterized protein n=1 Tax=Triticum urartu TaxID=4572 RepID=A0A8R7PPC5_TRIUA